jgi:hypothetical protein
VRSGISIHRVSEVRGLEELPFDCRSREVLSAEGSGEHMSRPSGGDHVVDRWTLIAWEGVNILLTYRTSEIH